MPRLFFRTLLAAATLLIGSSAMAEGFEQLQRKSVLVSPAGLGPKYSGLTGAGYGVAEGNRKFGVEAGDFVFLPRLFVEGAYETNYFRRNPETGIAGDPLTANEPIGLFMLDIRPGLGVYNPSPKRVAFSMSLDADIWVPFALEGDDPSVGVGLDADVALALFPRSVVGFTLEADFEREVNAQAASSTASADVNVPRVGADIEFRPGGGALEVVAGYRWAATIYDDLTYLDQQRHEARLLASWKFYPHTALFLETTLDMITWDSPPDTEFGDGPTRPSSFQPCADAEGITGGRCTPRDFAGNYLDAMPLKVMLGLSGHLTDRFSLLGRAGYGNSFLDVGDGPAVDDFSMFIGMAQATYRFTMGTALSVGVAYDFQPTALGGHLSYLRGYLSLDQKLGDTALLHIDAAVDSRKYGRWVAPPVERKDVQIEVRESHENREEVRLQAGAVIDFDIWRAFGITAGYRFEGIFTDFQIITKGSTDSSGTSASAGDFVNNVGYIDHRVYVSLNLRY